MEETLSERKVFLLIQSGHGGQSETTEKSEQHKHPKTISEHLESPQFL